MMARIPDYTSLGDRPVSTAAAAPAVDKSGQIQDQAMQAFGEGLENIGNQLFIDRANLARGKAANALVDHEIAVKTATQDLAQKVQTGELPYAQAKQTWEDSVANIQPAQIQYLDRVAQENLKRGADRNVFTEGIRMNQVVLQAEQNDFKDQFASNLDSLGKLAGLPGANIEDVNAKADAFAPMGRRAGIPPEVIDKTLQDFKDRNWFNNAIQVSMQSKDSMPDLQQLEHDLTDEDGFYAGKLDTDKRNAVLRTVVNDRNALEARIERAQEKRELAGDRALNQIDQQISSGVPATAQMWASWKDTVKGTPAEAEFNQRMQDESQVQSILRAPMDEQARYLQQRQATLDTEGGTLRDRANFERIRSAVQKNVNLMKSDPLLFSAFRNNQDVQPLDFQALSDPKTQGAFTQEVQSRMMDLSAMQRQYGPDIPNKPLLPQEASQLAAVLNSGTRSQQVQMLSALRDGAGDDTAYRAMMQQIFPDAPIKALAGMIASHATSIKLKNYFLSPGEFASGGDIATTLLEGERLLNPSTDEKKSDGKPSTSLFLPPAAVADLQSEFDAAVGDAFRGRPDAAEYAFQAVKAYYVGRAAQTGTLASMPKDVDTAMVQRSITAVLGDAVNFNGQGKILTPYGVSASEFGDRLHYKLKLMEAQGQLNANDVDWIRRSAGLLNNGSGSYYVTQGRNFVQDKHGNPLILDIENTHIPEPMHSSKMDREFEDQSIPQFLSP